jgi:hypothetical protein
MTRIGRLGLAFHSERGCLFRAADTQGNVITDPNTKHKPVLTTKRNSDCRAQFRRWGERVCFALPGSPHDSGFLLPGHQAKERALHQIRSGPLDIYRSVGTPSWLAAHIMTHGRTPYVTPPSPIAGDREPGAPNSTDERSRQWRPESCMPHSPG